MSKLSSVCCEYTICHIFTVDVYLCACRRSYCLPKKYDSLRAASFLLQGFVSFGLLMTLRRATHKHQTQSIHATTVCTFNL